MTATVGEPTDRIGSLAATGLDDRPRIAAVPVRPVRRTVTRPRIRAGQIVVTQVAVAGSAAATGRDALLLAAALVIATILLLVTWVPVRGRWSYEWLEIWLRRAGRQRRLEPAAPPTALLDLVAPGTVVGATELVGEPAAVIDDGRGLVALLELGDPTGLLGTAPTRLPALRTLLPAPDPDSPPVRLHLVLCGMPAPMPGSDGGPAGRSYRQLTEGRLLGRDRAVLAVRVPATDGWSTVAQHRALASAVRRVRRRLGPVGGRPLGTDAALGVLAELAHHDAGQPARETWPALRLGGLSQATFRLRWSRPAELPRRLVPRLLALPATATTVALNVGPWHSGGALTRSALDGEASLLAVELSVRVAAGGPTELAQVTRELDRLVTAEGGQVQRLDGEQLDGLAATLPLGVSGTPRPVPGATLDGLEIPVDHAGLMLGTNRHGAPVTVRLFRPEATRVVLIGGVRAAQLITLRAVALGARVVVRTSRPGAWEPFVRGVTVPGDPIPLIPPERPAGSPPGTPLRPLLVVYDATGPGPDATAEPGWQSTLVVRDRLTAPDVGLLARAELAVFQPLRPEEAALAGTALGLGDSSAWLTRIRADMVAVVNAKALRWVRLSPTPVEEHLVGAPARPTELPLG